MKETARSKKTWRKLPQSNLFWRENKALTPIFYKCGISGPSADTGDSIIVVLALIGGELGVEGHLVLEDDGHGGAHPSWGLVGADAVEFGDDADAGLPVDDELVGVGVVLVGGRLEELPRVVLPVLQPAEEGNQAEVE